MKTVKLFLLGLLFAACSTDPEPVKPVKGTDYTFNVRSVDGDNFTGAVSWGVDKIQYTDEVHAVEYASNFKAVPGHVFILSVETSDEVKLIFRVKSQPVKEMNIEPGRVYTFDHELNF